MDPANSHLSESYRYSERLTSTACKGLVMLMMVCLGVTLVELGNAFDPSWQGGYLPLVLGLVSLEAMHSFHLTRRLSDLRVSGFVFYLIEAVVLIIFIKSIMYLWHGPAYLLVDLRMMEADFIGVFFNGEFMIVLVFSIVVWVISRLFAQDLLEIQGDEQLLKGSLDGLRSDRKANRSRIASRIFTVGLFMVFFTGLVRLDLSSLGIQLPTVREDVINIMVYFFAGLALLALTQFAALRANWAWEKIPITRGIGQRWLMASVLFLILVAALALVLPTSYSLGFLTTFGQLLAIAGAFLYSLILLILMPLMLLISFLSRLFSNNESQSLPEQKLPDLGAEMGQVFTGSWMELLKALLFWAVFISVIVYAFYQYIRQNEELAGRLGKLPLFSWIVGGLRWLLEGLRVFNRRISSSVQSGLQQLARRSKKPGLARQGRFIHVGRLPPREKVLFFYLAMIRRGKQSGLARGPSQTPYEYARFLEGRLEELEKDVEGLTESFLEARYSRHEITPEKASFARRCWERLRQALNPRRQAGK